MKPSRRARSRATLLFPEAAGPSMAMMRRSAGLLVIEARWSERADDRRGHALPLRIDDLFQRLGKFGIGFLHAIGVLHDGFAIGEESGHGKGHRDAVISEAGDARAAQRTASVNLEAIVQFDDLRPHRAQIMRDRSDPVR